MSPRRTAATILILLFAAFMLGGCEEGLISREDEIRMGRQAGDEFEKSNGGLVPDAKLRAFVSEIGNRVTSAAEPPDYPYEVRVLNNKQVNAVAFPGGRIYVFKGLVTALDSDPDKLAWVIGHETAHVSQHHVKKRIEQAIGYQAVIAIVFKKKKAAKYAAIVAELILRDYGRDNEFQADRLGLRYAHDAGYDPTAAVSVLEKFREIQGRDPNDFEIMFATHPGNNDRVNAVKRYLDKMGWGGKYYRPQSKPDTG